jgi:hypothetical protein
MFESTKPGTAEDRKAEIKNHNLPIIQYMYMGSKDTPLCCVVSKTPAFTVTKDYGNPGQTKTRFRIEFNHIRQKTTMSKSGGISLDKDTRAPSGIFRETRFDSEWVEHAKFLVEFMAIMPICTEVHKHVTQDSQKKDITLENFDNNERTWVLQSAKNFKQFCDDFELGDLNYTQFIDHLSNIGHAPLHDRLKWNKDRGFYLT